MTLLVVAAGRLDSGHGSVITSTARYRRIDHLGVCTTSEAPRAASIEAVGPYSHDGFAGDLHAYSDHSDPYYDDDSGHYEASSDHSDLAIHCLTSTELSCSLPRLTLSDLALLC